jgi:hypothetical protein
MRHGFLFEKHDFIKKTRRPCGLRVNPIQEDLEETGAILPMGRKGVCFIFGIGVIRFAYTKSLIKESLSILNKNAPSDSKMLI